MPAMERRVPFTAALVLLAAGCQPVTSTGGSPTPTSAATTDARTAQPGHLPGTVGVRAALRRLSAEDQQRARQIYSSDGTLTFDLWVDSRHRPTKVRVTDGDSLDTTVSFQYGGSVAIS